LDGSGIGDLHAPAIAQLLAVHCNSAQVLAIVTISPTVAASPSDCSGNRPFVVEDVRSATAVSQRSVRAVPDP
jgi:hypothetical protein